MTPRRVGRERTTSGLRGKLAGSYAELKTPELVRRTAHDLRRLGRHALEPLDDLVRDLPRRSSDAEESVRPCAESHEGERFTEQGVAFERRADLGVLRFLFALCLAQDDDGET